MSVQWARGAELADFQCSVQRWATSRYWRAEEKSYTAERAAASAQGPYFRLSACNNHPSAVYIHRTDPAMQNMKQLNTFEHI